MNIGKINPVSFGKHYTNVDIGASSIKGSLKICALDENGEVIKKEKTTVFNDREKRSEERFEENVAKRIAEFENKNSDAIKEKDPENEVCLTVCYPGAKSKEGFTVSNFYYDDNKTHSFERPINSENIDSYLKERGINISQTRHVNDMAGAGACLLSKLETDYPETLKEGDEIMYFYPGGGLGTGVFIVDDDNIKIKPMEIQHIKNNRNVLSGGSLEDDAGAAGLRRNYENALRILGYGDEIQGIIGENTKVVTSYDEARKVIPNLTPSMHHMASCRAIDELTYSIAQIIAERGCESRLNTVVLTGPIAKGVKEFLDSSPVDLYGQVYDYSGDKFTRQLKVAVGDSLTPVGKKLLNPEDLNVIFIEQEDNTQGAQILQRGKEVGEPAAWYNIKKED